MSYSTSAHLYTINLLGVPLIGLSVQILVAMGPTQVGTHLFYAYFEPLWHLFCT